MLQWINKKLSATKTANKISLVLFLAVFLFFSALFLVPEVSFAQSVNDPNSELQQGVQIIEEPLGLPSTDIRLIVARIIQAALGLIGIVLVAIIIYGGFLYMTAGGNESQIDKAKKVLVNAVIGLVIILSAFAIVSFVMRLLGVDTSGGPSTGQVGEPGAQNFSGSGSLGQIVRDHYPTRNQTNVPRNTKIAVTFNKPILVENLVTDTNGNGIYGDCLVSDTMDWRTDCDALNMGDQYINISAVTEDAEGNQTLSPVDGAALLASYVPSVAVEGKQDVYTIVIRPYDYLGSEIDPVKYLVHLGNEIRLDDSANGNPQAFTVATVGNTFYEWNFTCGTELDLSPPYVIDAYPKQDMREVKNTSIQITFNEAIDPIGVQGSFSVTGVAGTYVLQGNNVFLKNNNSTIPLGRFTLLNNYKTMEFSSTQACGQNACGRNVYCLPVCDESGASCNEDGYEILLRAGRTLNTDTFEAIPFSGVMDMSGNALDGNHDGVVNRAPNTDPVFPTQKAPDNYYWNFTLIDELDLTAPYLLQITPGPESTYVPNDRPWTMLFSKRMRIEPMYGIGLTESPSPTERCPSPSSGCNAEPLWRVPGVSIVNDASLSKEVTLVNMLHGEFLEGLRQIYIPYLNSEIEDVHYNCMYPGQGPNSNTDSASDKSARCQDGVDCCINSADSHPGDFCCNGSESGTTETASSSCLNTLRLP